MTGAKSDPRLGTQVWLEKHDSPQRIAALVDAAAEVGFGQLRIFLMWPWIQEHSAGEWDFRIFDAVFDAAARRGLVIKATLTANSGPWWLGTPSLLHSHTLTLDESWFPAAAEYVARCVDRYAEHPALGQWILWNEPNNPLQRGHSGIVRSAGSREAWTELLLRRYGGRIEAVNSRWRTGYATFDEVPFPEDVTHPAQSDSVWRSFAPLIDEYHLRAELLEGELKRVATIVRSRDKTTPLCINPNQTLLNHAEHGYRLKELASTVDVLGASFHAPWSFAFAKPDDHTALIVAGLSLLANTPGGHGAEVTEVQTGNTCYAGKNPLGVGPAEIAATYLAPLLAGAQSVTGWCFNTREQDFEAGEWGLLDDADTIGDRALAVSKVRDVLDSLDGYIGTWTAGGSDAILLTSEDSQAVQLALAESSVNFLGRASDAAAQGSALLAVELNRIGVRCSMAPVSALDRMDGLTKLIIVSHMAAWDSSFAERLLALAHAGATVLVDGISGEFDLDARLHRPWPGGLAERTGLRSAGLHTSRNGDRQYLVQLFGHPLSTVTNVRSDLVITDGAWHDDTALTYGTDSRPVLWERTWGEGRLMYCTAALSTSALNKDDPRSVAAYVLSRAAERIHPEVRPLSPATFVLSVRGATGSAVGVFAPSSQQRNGAPFTVTVPAGTYVDVWSGARRKVGPDGVLCLDTTDGIALLVRQPLAPGDQP